MSRDQGSRTARWSRLAATGLVLLAGGAMFYPLTAVLFGVDTESGIFVASILVSLIGAFLVARFGVWGKVAAIVAALLAALPLFWTIFGLFTPASFFDFVPGVVVLPGAILGIAASVAAIRAQRRGDLVAAPEGGERNGIRIALGITLVLAALSGVLTLVSRSTGDRGAADATVTMSDFEFHGEGLTVGGGASLLVENDDPFFHTFTIEELGIDIALNPGSSQTLEIPERPGEYHLICEPHLLQGMEAEFRVQ